MAFVEFADVSKIYQMGEVEVAAVRDMSFTIEQGEFVVIVGPSGAGKTTLLNMLGGMDSATSGTIMLDGARVSSFNRKQLTQYRRHDIGFVFQFYNLVQNLTARENVELASQICRDPLDAEEVLAAVGLADRVRNFPGQRSGVEQQRAGFAADLIVRGRQLQVVALGRVRDRAAGQKRAAQKRQPLFVLLQHPVIDVQRHVSGRAEAELRKHFMDFFL